MRWRTNPEFPLRAHLSGWRRTAIAADAFDIAAATSDAATHESRAATDAASDYDAAGSLGAEHEDAQHEAQSSRLANAYARLLTRLQDEVNARGAHALLEGLVVQHELSGPV